MPAPAPERTVVGIVGGGPAGLLLSHLLHRSGVDHVVLEARSREEIEHTHRAGILEAGAVQVLVDAGLDRVCCGTAPGTTASCCASTAPTTAST